MIGIILITAKGKRVMEPDFGCGIHAYPEWTNHNLSEPWITLIDLFA